MEAICRKNIRECNLKTERDTRQAIEVTQELMKREGKKLRYKLCVVVSIAASESRLRRRSSSNAPVRIYIDKAYYSNRGRRKKNKIVITCLNHKLRFS